MSFPIKTCDFPQFFLPEAMGEHIISLPSGRDPNIMDPSSVSFPAVKHHFLLGALEHEFYFPYPLVNIQIAIENGHL